MSAEPPSFPEHVLFDLDDTLYPASSGFFGLVSKRITSFIQDRVGLAAGPARVLQRRYWGRYGTSLRGLMLRHLVEPGPFLEFVHDVPVEEHLQPDPELRRALAAIPAHRHLFTNGPTFYATRVLGALGVADLFERVFDIVSFGYVPKPNPEPYDVVERALGAGGRRLLLVDDALRNLPPACARGWFGVWLRTGEASRGEASPGGKAEADLVIDRLDDFTERIREAYAERAGAARGRSPASRR